MKTVKSAQNRPKRYYALDMYYFSVYEIPVTLYPPYRPKWKTEKNEASHEITVVFLMLKLVSKVKSGVF